MAQVNFFKQEFNISLNSGDKYVFYLRAWEVQDMSNQNKEIELTLIYKYELYRKAEKDVEQIKQAIVDSTESFNKTNDTSKYVAIIDTLNEHLKTKSSEFANYKNNYTRTFYLDDFDESHTDEVFSSLMIKKMNEIIKKVNDTAKNSTDSIPEITNTSGEDSTLLNSNNRQLSIKKTNTTDYILTKLKLSELFYALMYAYKVVDVPKIVSGYMYAKPQTKLYDLTEYYKKMNPNLIGGKKDRRLRTRRDALLLIELKGLKTNKFDTTKLKSSYLFNIVDDSQTTASLEGIGLTAKENTDSIQAGLLKTISTVPFIINMIELEIVDGYIFNVIVKGNSGLTPINLTNIFPIPFSTKRNYSHLHLAILYNMNYNKMGKLLAIPLSDIFEYVPALSLSSYDYSPADGVYKIVLKNGQTAERTFYKEEYSKILKSRIYSDFVGFDEKKPNGLIQFEVFKPVVINHNYNSLYYWFKYVEPRIVWSKIETENRDLVLSVIDSMKPISTTIDIFRYSFLKFGTDVNIGEFFFPRTKTFLDINMGAYNHYTSFSIPSISEEDSLGDTTIVREEQSFTENSWSIEGEIKCKFRIDPRWGVDLSCRAYVLKLISDRVEQDGVIRKNLFHNDSFISPQIYAFLKPDPYGTDEFYFRAALYKSFDTNNIFSQIQIGYSKVITKSRITKTESKE